jgi:phenylalanyl-tRNA synthetase alpha subunit
MPLEEKLHAMEEEFDADLRALSAKYVGKGGKVEDVTSQLGALSTEDRRVVGGRLNQFVQRVGRSFQAH